MAKPIKFKRLTDIIVDEKYGIVPSVLRHDDELLVDIGRVPVTSTFGEVKCPGHGWVACVIDVNNIPTHFHTDDDGWMCIMPNVLFEEIK